MKALNAMQTSDAGALSEPDWAALYTGEPERKAAHAHWVEIRDELRDASVLSAGNGHAIRRLVEARILYERSALDVAQRGVMIPAPRTKTPMHNPHYTTMRQAEESCRMLEAELCIAIARRRRALKVNQKRKIELARDAYLRPADNYLKPSNGGPRWGK